MKKRFYYFNLLLGIVFALTSQAQIKRDDMDALLNERTQLEYCATYMPCAIAVGIMDSTATGMSFADKVKAYIRTFGNTPIRSEREFRAYLNTLSTQKRQEYVSKCINQRGSNMREYCEESYLSDSELKSLKASRSSQSPDVTKESAIRARKSLADKDADLMSVLGPSCRMTANGPSYGCNTLLEEISRFDREITAFNRDQITLQFVSPFESAAINKIMTIYDKDNDHGTIKWIPKASLTTVKTDLTVADSKPSLTPAVVSTNTPSVLEDEVWKSLPKRAGDAAVDKQFEGVLNASKSISSSDPYAGTSSRLSPEQFEMDKQRSQESNGQSMALLNGLLSAAVAYKSGGKTKALEAFIQSQTESTETAKPDAETDTAPESTVTTAGSGGNSSGQCDSLIAKQEREFDVVNRRNVGTTASMQRVMWMTSERIKLIRASCPSTSKYQQMIKELQNAFNQAKTACGQISSGGGCVAKSY
jgi:hypothetical protein